MRVARLHVCIERDGIADGVGDVDAGDRKLWEDLDLGEVQPITFPGKGEVLLWQTVFPEGIAGETVELEVARANCSKKS